MKLTATNVRDVLLDCFFTREEVPTDTKPVDFVEAYGVRLQAYFHPQRLESHRKEVKDMLDELPQSFHDKGDSFLAMGETREGVQWGEHQSMDALFTLGLALGYVKMFPRDLWKILPGGMPVLTVKTK